MDWGVITAVVAAIFGAIGIALGFFMAKFFFGKEENYSVLEERVEGAVNRISEIVERLNERLSSLRQERFESLKEELNSLREEIERLKGEVSSLPVSRGSLEAIERAELLLKDLDLSLPTVDTSILTQIKDSLIILRNDIQTLLQSQQRGTKGLPEVNSIIDTLNSAIDLSKRINASLVKGELLSLADSIKGGSAKELVKELDSLSLESKELVLLLEGIKKELEGVNK